MISRRSFLVSSGACALTAWAGPAPASDPFHAVTTRLQQFVDDGQLPFASLRVARHGRVLLETHASGIEQVGPESIYRIYSMTKPIVAAGIMLLVEDGRLDLQDPVAEHIAEFADMKVVDSSQDAGDVATPMNVSQLLTHACGLANSWGEGRVAPLYRDAGLIANAWITIRRSAGWTVSRAGWAGRRWSSSRARTGSTAMDSTSPGSSSSA